jgi:hypothetical protein
LINISSPYYPWKAHSRGAVACAPGAPAGYSQGSPQRGRCGQWFLPFGTSGKGGKTRASGQAGACIWAGEKYYHQSLRFRRKINEKNFLPSAFHFQGANAAVYRKAQTEGMFFQIQYTIPARPCQYKQIKRRTNPYITPLIQADLTVFDKCLQKRPDRRPQGSSGCARRHALAVPAAREGRRGRRHLQ